MPRGCGSSLIPVVVFVAILLIGLPASADNVTVTSTTAAANVTTAAVNETAIATTQTTVPPAQTTVATNQTTVTTVQTTAVPTQTSATPTNTTVAPTLTTVVTTVKPSAPGTTAVTTGSIIVHSSPTGASVLIDGIYSGTTPKIVSGVPAGNHILRLSLSGYHDYEGSIYVVAGQTAQGYGTLQPINPPASAVLTTVPTAVVPVIVTVAPATPGPADTGLLGDSAIIAAVLGAFAVIIVSAARIFTHVKPPQKE